MSGDLDRLPMLTWIMFLKFLDDLEQIREHEAAMAGKKFRKAINDLGARQRYFGIGMALPVMDFAISST